MSKLDPRIEAIRVKYGLEASDFWELPQKKGTWIAKHSALEIVAAKANIVWAMPQIIEANSGDGIAAMVVMGTLESRSEWATGEASNKNNKNAYPWAMAEKRGKDRVVLKLSGVAGLVYSEDEADDFRQSAPAPSKAPAKPVEAEINNPAPDPQNLYARLSIANAACQNKAAFNKLWGAAATIKAQASLSPDVYAKLETEKANKFDELEKQEPSEYKAPNFDNLQSDGDGA